MERKGLVTSKGKPLTLLGPELKVGEKAPDFTVIDKGMLEVSLGDFVNTAKLISTTPSLDTAVCDAQARRFNEEAAKLGDGIAIINVSMDLPFAISRFCSTASIDRIKTFSDYRHASLGVAFGILIKELRLLTRSIFLLDKDNVIKYIEIVPEMSHAVDFDKALAAARDLLARK